MHLVYLTNEEKKKITDDITKAAEDISNLSEEIEEINNRTFGNNTTQIITDYESGKFFHYDNKVIMEGVGYGLCVLNYEDIKNFNKIKVTLSGNGSAIYPIVFFNGNEYSYFGTRQFYLVDEVVEIPFGTKTVYITFSDSNTHSVSLLNETLEEKVLCLEDSVVKIDDKIDEFDKSINGIEESKSENFELVVGKFYHKDSNVMMDSELYASLELIYNKEYEYIYVKTANMTGTAVRPIVFYNGESFTEIGEYNTPYDDYCLIPKDTEKIYITVNTTQPYEAYYFQPEIYGLLKDVEALKEDNKRLSGLKIGFFGDSIVGTDYTTPTWWEYISEKTGCIPYNYGKSGTSIAYHQDRETTFGKCFANRYTEMNDDLDCIVVMGGTNDIDNVCGTPLGNWNDNTNTTLFGALNILIKGLLNKYSGKPIIFCTPIPRNYSQNSSEVNVLNPLGELERKSPTDTLTCQLISEAIKSKCKQYGVKYIDMQTCGITGSDDTHVYFRESDSYHLSEIGQKVIANYILPTIKNCFEII